MNDVWVSVIWIAATILLVVVNGFFVAAEFALVKLRAGRLAEMVRGGEPFAGSAQWLMRRLDKALSACQLGITMASLGLGWVGEPAIARLLEPLLKQIGITAPKMVHMIAFIVAFTIITAAHLVIGEQAPKIYAIRRPEKMALWCAVPLRIFYVLSFPLLMALDMSTSYLLRRLGVDGASGHDDPHSEEEIRALLSAAHLHGELTRSEANLLDAVFEFDDIVARQIMMPRVEVAWLDVNAPLANAIEVARRTMHSRYPLCETSLDDIVGIVHVKDLVGVSEDSDVDLRTIARPPRYVPETMPIKRLLGHFQATRQHLALVVDEHGSMSGVVTLENVLEKIVGEVQDEFDSETPEIVPDGPGAHLVAGATPIALINRKFGLALDATDVDSMAGYAMQALGRIPVTGDRIELDGTVIEVVEAQHSRAARLRIVQTEQPVGEV